MCKVLMMIDPNKISTVQSQILFFFFFSKYQIFPTFKFSSHSDNYSRFHKQIISSLFVMHKFLQQHKTTIAPNKVSSVSHSSNLHQDWDLFKNPSKSHSQNMPTNSRSTSPKTKYKKIYRSQHLLGLQQRATII